MAEDYDEFEAELDKFKNHSGSNRRVAALSAYYANQKEKEDEYPFYPNPLEKIWISQLGSDEQIDLILSQLEKPIIKLQKVWEPEAKTTRNGFRTTGNIFDAENEAFANLEQTIRSLITKYKDEVTFDTDCKFYGGFPNKFNVKGWYNELVKGGNHVRHIHPAGWVSGVVYFSNLPKSKVQNEGAIEFSLEGYNYPIFIKRGARKVINPNRGDIIFFPS